MIKKATLFDRLFGKRVYVVDTETDEMILERLALLEKMNEDKDRKLNLIREVMVEFKNDKEVKDVQ